MSRNGVVISLGLLMIAAASWNGACRAANADQPLRESHAASTPYDFASSSDDFASSPYNAAGLYDRGNSAARADESALAVLNYERALLLSPRDSDIRANLRRVQGTAGLASQPEHWLSQHARFANPDTLYWIGLLGLILAGSAYVLYRARLPRRGTLVAVGAIGAAVMALSITDAVATAPILHDAVMMHAADASASPISGAESLFTEPSAAVVNVRDEHREFVLIHDLQGRDGWVARSSLAFIVPRAPRASPAT